MPSSNLLFCGCDVIYEVISYIIYEVIQNKTQRLAGPILKGESQQKNLLSYPANTLELTFYSLCWDTAIRTPGSNSHVYIMRMPLWQPFTNHIYGYLATRHLVKSL